MKKLLITLILSAAVIFSVVAAKNLYSAEIPIHNRGIRDCISQGDLDVLLVGSSTFRCNIDMHEMDRAFDGKAYDISYGGNQLAAATIQYDELKARSPHGYKLMVFELGPLMLTEEVKISDSRVIWDLSYPGKKALWERMKESGNTDFPLWYEYFITSGLDDLFTYPVTEPFYATRYYKGVKTEETPSPGKEILEKEAFDISDLTMVETQKNALTDLIRKCREDGQRFVFVESPHYYRLQEDPVYQEYLREFIRILEENGADYILASDVDYDDHDASCFEDMNHMSGPGRTLYTKKLIPLISPPS